LKSNYFYSRNAPRTLWVALENLTTPCVALNVLTTKIFSTTLPDGIFANPPKKQFWYIYVGTPHMKWKFFIYFMAMWYRLWQFGIVCGQTVHFTVLVY
jgi:hypothetical protein